MSEKAKKSQADKFKQAARELETDNDEKRFDETLRKLAKTESDKKPDPEKGKSE